MRTFALQSSGALQVWMLSYAEFKQEGRFLTLNNGLLSKQIDFTGVVQRIPGLLPHGRHFGYDSIGPGTIQK